MVVRPGVGGGSDIAAGAGVGATFGPAVGDGVDAGVVALAGTGGGVSEWGPKLVPVVVPEQPFDELAQARQEPSLQFRLARESQFRMTG